MSPEPNPEDDKNWREHDRLTATIAVNRRTLDAALSTLPDLIEEVANREYQLGELNGRRMR